MRTHNGLIRIAATLVAAWALLYVVMPVPEATAIPAFARKYGFSCSTCHAPVPRLKAYGEDFAANGFKLPDDEEPIRAYRDVGDPLLLLQRELPVAVRFDAYALQGIGDDDYADLQTPWGAKLLSGGQVASNVGYYFYFYMNEAGEVAGIEDAYIHFNNLMGAPLDIMVGQFQISDPLMKRELRLTYEDYLAYKVQPGVSLTKLTYDRGVMVTYDTPFGLGLVGEVVNGNGKPEADGGLYDGDKDKAYAFRGIYGLGPLNVGGFWYGTKEWLQVNPGDPFFANEVTYWGPDFNLSVADGRYNLSGQYLMRTDTDAGSGLLDIETEGYIGEFVWLPRGEDGRMALTALYNRITSDDAALAYETATLSGSYLLARNLRLMAEFTQDMERDSGRLLLGFVSGF